MSDCPNDSHVHRFDGVVFFHGHAVIDHSRGLLILTNDHDVAERIAALINLHGLVDVPDDAAALTAPWPAPTGRPRVLYAHLHRLPTDPTKERTT